MGLIFKGFPVQIAEQHPNARFNLMANDEGAAFYRCHVESRRLVLTRTPKRYDSVLQVRPSFEALYAEMANYPADGYDGVIIDLRQILGRNDAEFEVAIKPLRRELLTSLSRCAIIVQSPTGRMQLSRYMFRDGIGAPVVTSMEEAIEATSPDRSASGET